MSTLNINNCPYVDKVCGIHAQCTKCRNNPGTGRRLTPYERTKAQVYATGNKWAIENFHATHD